MAIPISTPSGTDSEIEAGPSTRRYSLSQTLSAHNRSVTALRFSNDGSVLVSAGADGWLHFWDPENGDHIRGFRAHKTGINDISISPDSLYVSTASDDSTSLIHYLTPPPSSSNATPDPALGSHSNGEAGSEAPLRILTGHTAPVLSIAFSPKSNLLVTGSFDESAIIWDVKRGRVLRSLPAHADAIWCVGWDTEGGMVLTAGADGLIRLWDVNTGQCLKTLDNDTNSPVSYATFTPSSYFLLSSTLSSTLRIYNIHTSKVLKTLQAPGSYISEKYPCPAIVFTAPQPQPTPTCQSSDRAGNDVDVNMDVDGDSDGTETQKRVDGKSEEGKKKEAWTVSGSENGKIIIWDLQSKKLIQILPGHTNPIVAIAVHPSGRLLASGSLQPDKTIKLWRVD
ncbi:uncharacterized protein IL334_001961 [Kwoniella shivajii]|uniref:Chromatin binding protein n=1 Tax=Kwoniella shivajii TaxID=564305 RepID=A0ABZ1CTD8_9TREE|nr:hypothetical protein IL334_001961 [Kwoniella shivajii]